MKILFICNANIFRSQYATYFFNSLTKKHHAKSEGWYDSCTNKLIKYDDCMETPDDLVCQEGCLLQDSCINYGTRAINDNTPQFCDTNEDFKNQKQIGVACQNNYECTTNLCLGEVCTDLNEDISEIKIMITRIFDWIKRWF